MEGLSEGTIDGCRSKYGALPCWGVLDISDRLEDDRFYLDVRDVHM